ncbi:MAG: hypothetical protein JWQ54_5916 [Mucilaginibacter sp.]|nr:hypothetical protein [Mucilaginibacter sp.]
MFNIYYKIWVDAIVFEQTKNGQRRNWKTFTLLPVSVIQGINLLTILFWTRALTHAKIPLFFDINIFNTKGLNTLIPALLFFMPFIVLNYLLIIYNQRYENLIAKYKYYNGKLYLGYFLFSTGVFILPIIMGKILGL